MIMTNISFFAGSPMHFPISFRSRATHAVIHCMTKRLLLVGGFITLTAAPATAIAQTATSTAQPLAPPLTYLYLSQGGDTIGTEVVTHESTSITGVLTLKGQPRIEWVQSHENAKPGVLTLRVFAPGAPADAPPVQQGTAETRNDSVYVDFTGGTQRTKQAIASKAGALPLINASVLHAALLTSYAQRAKMEQIDLFLTSGAQTVQGMVMRAGDTTVFKLGNTEMRILVGADGMPSVVELPGQNARVVRANSAVKLPGADASGANYDAPPGAPYTATHVRIPSGRGYELAATLTLPKGVAKSAVVITISGSGPQERDSRISLVPGYEIFRQIADTLGRRGVATLRYDDRAVGESGGRDGAAQATSANAADDVRAIVAWLRNRPDIDADRIILAGHSEGGVIAPMLAATDSRIKAIALLAGTAYTGRRVIMYQNKQAISAAPGLTPAQRDSILAAVPAQLDSAGKATPWLGYFLSYDPVVTAKLVKQPVLVMQGETDQQVTAEQADTLVVAIRSNGNTKVTLKKFANANHLFLQDTSGAPQHYAELPDPKVRKDVLGALADWAVGVVK